MMQHVCCQAYRILRRAFNAALIIGLVGSFLISLVIVFHINPGTADSTVISSVDVPPNNPNSILSRDVYYYEKFKVQGIISGPPAPRLRSEDYPRLNSSSPFLGESRLIIWILAQQHLYWGSFVLGVLMLITVLEAENLLTRNGETVQRYDAFACEMLRVVMLALSVAAILGGLLLFGLLLLYPDFTKYLANVFRPMFATYGLLLVVFSTIVFLYYSTWQRMSTGWLKWLHATLGVFVNVLGTMLILLANAWNSFMMSPAGVDEQGRFLGNYWHVLHTALWNPTNVHRVAGNIVFGAAVVAAYATYRTLTAKTDAEKAHYDRMSYLAFLAVVFALFTIPAGGYWLSREIYAYRQSMGITIFGGLLAWLGVVLVSLVGALFLGINYYIWQRIAATEAGERYRHYPKYVFFGLALCLVSYLTPHTPVLTSLELKELVGVDFKPKPVWWNFGVESAKQSSINIIMVLTMWSLVIWWKCEHKTEETNRRNDGAFINGFFLIAILNLLWLGIYGYYIPANVRVGLQIPMVMTTLSTVILGAIVFARIPKSKTLSQPVWGNLTVRGHYMLFFLAFTISWIMGLGGYRRSSLRLFWHVNEIMRDNSPWSFTHTTGFAANVITLNALIFWFGLMLLVWLATTGGAVRHTNG